MRKFLLAVSLVALSLRAFGLGACVTNASVGVLYSATNFVATMQPFPYYWCLCIEDDAYNWHGTGIISSMNSCTNTVWDGIPLESHALTPPDHDVNIGMVSIACANGSNASAPITFPANCGDVTFHFIASCSGTNCAVTVCPVCSSWYVPPQ